mmetsp:Transcript_41148/g.118356  ORF Transcript_41148/g.118356 Transcript_41148/m.118356 type:complete len:257 (-) Transcript_41148:699-1469(-)
MTRNDVSRRMASQSILTSPVISSMQRAHRQAARISPAAIGRNSPPFKRTSTVPPALSFNVAGGAAASPAPAPALSAPRSRSRTTCARSQKLRNAGRSSLSGFRTKGYCRATGAEGYSGACDKVGSNGSFMRPMPFSSKNLGNLPNAPSANKSCERPQPSQGNEAMLAATTNGGMLTFSKSCTPFVTSATLMLLRVVTITAPSTGNVCASESNTSPVPGGVSTMRTSKAPHSMPVRSCVVICDTMGARIVAASPGLM